ncbi:MAG: hypothetical protein IPL49_07420 [Saprospirales bacterium]|nr:hypothetical protein [Saprospirales bacterium]
MTRYALFSIVLFLISCQPDPNQVAKVVPFFDLEAFFQKEISEMPAEQSAEKKITLNGKTETKKLADWAASQELEGFKEFNINRPAWHDQYQVDSLRNMEGTLEGIRYMALDSSLRIRQLDIDWAPSGEISEVRVEKFSKNMVVYFHQKLRYRPGKGYWLWREQKVPFTKRSELEVEVSY